MTDINPDDYPYVPYENHFDDDVAVLDTPEGRRFAFDFVQDLGLTAGQRENRRKIFDFRCKFYEMSTNQDAEVLAKYRYMRNVAGADNDLTIDLPMAFIFNTSLGGHTDVIEEQLDIFKKWVLDNIKRFKNFAVLENNDALVDEIIRDSHGRDITTKALEVMEMAYKVFDLRKRKKTQVQVAQILGVKSTDPTETVRRYEKNARELVLRAEVGFFPYNETGEWALPNP